jgi:hypothetical protein
MWRWSTKTATLKLTQRFLSKDLKWERQEACEREWEVFLRLEMEFCACSTVRKSVGGVYKGAPKSWWPLGKSDWNSVEPVSTRGFQFTGGLSRRLDRTQIRLNRTKIPLNRFSKNLHTTFSDWQTGRSDCDTGEQCRNPVEPVLGPVEPVFETEEQVLIKLSWTKMKL